MRSVLIACAAFGLMACEALTGAGSGITEADIDNIEDGNATGVIFSGTWDLKTEVTESTCGGLLDFLPAKGDKEDESVTFAQTGGSLTRVIDEFGDSYVFKGSVNADGTFTYGEYYDLSENLDLPLRYIELVTGQVELDDGGGAATMTATAERRYQSGIVDCSATVRINGERGSLTE
jgi:hypothetical protein